MFGEIYKYRVKSALHKYIGGMKNEQSRINRKYGRKS